MRERKFICWLDCDMGLTSLVPEKNCCELFASFPKLVDVKQWISVYKL